MFQCLHVAVSAGEMALGELYLVQQQWQQVLILKYPALIATQQGCSVSGSVGRVCQTSQWSPFGFLAEVHLLQAEIPPESRQDPSLSPEQLSKQAFVSEEN